MAIVDARFLPASLSELLYRISSLENQVIEFQSSSSDDTSSIDFWEMQTALNEQKDNVQSLQERILELEEYISELQGNSSQSDSTVDFSELSSRISDAEERIASMEAELSGMSNSDNLEERVEQIENVTDAFFDA